MFTSKEIDYLSTTIQNLPSPNLRYIFSQQKQDKKQEYFTKNRPIGLFQPEECFEINYQFKIPPTNIRSAIYDEKLIEKRELLKNQLNHELIQKIGEIINPFSEIFHPQFKSKDVVILAYLNYLFHFIPELDSFNFLELCGFGGFSEFIFSKSKGNIKGFQFPVNLQIEDQNQKILFQHPNLLTYQGNISNLENINTLIKQSFYQANRQQLHLVLGYSLISGLKEKNDKQEFSRIFLSEILIMFRTLMKGGSFLCRISGFLNQFTLGLLFILYHSFEQFWLFQPELLDDDLEFYVICRGFQFPAVLDYNLLEALRLLSPPQSIDPSSIEIVPLKIIFDNYIFIDYVKIFLKNLLENSIDKLEKLNLLSDKKSPERLKLKFFNYEEKIKIRNDFFDLSGISNIIFDNNQQNNQRRIRKHPNNIQNQYLGNDFQGYEDFQRRKF